MRDTAIDRPRPGATASAQHRAVGDVRPRLPVRTSYLHRPTPPTGGLVRSRLHDVLDRGIELPASLVCAPAGFGKSVVVSQWCEHVEGPVAWFSLDPAVDHPRWFLMHLIAAVRRVFPDALDVASQMVSADHLPSEEAVIAELSNELDELPERLIVVFDDYQHVTEPRTHRLVADLIRRPSPPVHLVIISREEPALPIGTLRAHGHLAELRTGDLAFSADELGLFIEQELHRELTPQQVGELHGVTEGWPAGARLAAEALRVGGDDAIVGAGFLDEVAQEYLVAGVLERTPPQIRQYLYVASHFDRFSAALCDAVATSLATNWRVSTTGAEFVDWIRRHNLFVVPLDETGEWFRFHPLFARLLADWRASSGSDLAVSEGSIRRAAAAVFGEQGQLEEAIEQLHRAGADDELAVVVAAHGDQLVEEGRWVELARLVSRIPAQVLDDDPELLMLRACVVGENESRYLELAAILDRVELLLDGRTDQGRATDRWLRGQIAVLRGVYSKFIEADFEGAITDAETARRLLHDHPGRRLTLAYILGVAALAGAGRSAEGHRLADSAVGDPRFAHLPFDPTAVSRSYVGWLEGDLDSVERYAAQLLAAGGPLTPHNDVRTLGHYFLGVCAYERDQLADAERHLAIVCDRRYATKAIYAAHAGMALACTHLAQGRPEAADETAQSMMQFVLDTRSEFLQPVADAFMAEFDLRRDRPGTGLRWARSVVSPLQRHRFMWFDPAPAIIEVLLSSEPDAAHGRELLDLALESARSRHHRPLIIRLLGLRALDRAAHGDEPGALDALEEAVRMSHQGGIIRRLADLGPPLTPLLHRLNVTGDLLTHVGAILTALDVPHGHGASDAHPGVVISVAGETALTDRERDVLRLLANRYSNKEIAQELTVAPATVKKHTVTLYEKLAVHGRREAVAKARALGYIDG